MVAHASHSVNYRTDPATLFTKLASRAAPEFPLFGESPSAMFLLSSRPAPISRRYGRPGP